MKKSLLLLSVVAAAFSCAEVEQVTPTINNEAKQITIGVAMPDEAPATRVAVSEDITSGDWVTNWEAGDAIAVYQRDEYQVAKFDITDGFTPKNASFSGKLANVIKPIRMIYPYNKFRFDQYQFPINLVRQNVEINSLNTVGDYSYMINEAPIENPTANIDNQKMVHLTAALELNLRFSGIEAGTKATISHIIAGVDGDSYIEVPSYARINLLNDVTSDELYASKTNGAITIIPTSECVIANYDETSATEYSIPFNAMPFDIANAQTLAIAVYVNYIEENGRTTSKKIVLEATNYGAETISFAAGTHSAINKSVDMTKATANTDGEYVSTIFTEDFEDGVSNYVMINENQQGKGEIIDENGSKVFKFASKYDTEHKDAANYYSQMHFRVADGEKNLVPGATYEISFRIKSDLAITADSGQFQANNGDWVASINDKINITTEWSDVVIRCTLPAKDDNAFVTQTRGIVFCTGTSPDCTLYLDDVVLREVNEYYVDPTLKPCYWKEITSGGDFEGETNDLASAIYGASGKIAVDTDGNKVFKVTSTNAGGEWNGQLYIAKHSEVAKDVKCKLSFRAKSEQSSTIKNLAAQWKDSDGNDQYDCTLPGTVATSTEWQDFSFEYTTAHDRVYTVKAPIGLLVDTFYFDDVKVCIWTNEE